MNVDNFYSQNSKYLFHQAATLLVNVQLEHRDFLTVGFTHPHGGSGGASVAGGDRGFSLSRGDGDVHAGYSGNVGGAAHAPPGQGRQLARSSGLQAAAVGPVSDFSADPAPAVSSAIGLGDTTLVDRHIQQLPLLAVAREPDGFDSSVGGQAGKDAGGMHAVPEPATCCCWA